MTEAQLRIRFITYNARLMEAKEHKGYTQKDLHLLTGIKVSQISAIFTLRARPKEAEMDELAAALDSDKNFLFPTALLEAQKEGLFERRLVELEEKDLVALSDRHRIKELPPHITDDEMLAEVDRALLRDRIDEVMSVLRPREQEVLKWRFGLEGREQLTLAQTGNKFDVTQERIRQIESKALRHLRHPTYSRRLKEFLA